MAKTKIAILGGGIGALSAAFMLTEQKDWKNQYEITVYQMGWRLGGKGANGRNAKMNERIEEHGLHVWFGFYENAFWMIRRCYHLLKLNWKDFFEQQNWITPMEERRGTWIPWEIPFLRKPGQPGDGATFPDPRGYVTELLELIGESNAAAGVASSEDTEVLDQAIELALRLPLDVTQHDPAVYRRIIELLTVFEKALHKSAAPQFTGSDLVRRFWILMNLGISAVRGMLRDGVITHGFDCLDAFDLREWLQRHGARRASAWSAVVRAVYDGVFAYEKGDPGRPNLAAGTGLRGGLRLILFYKGAFLWKMQAGMGETVFTPLYLVLKERGVNFEFFHRVDKLELAADRRSIAAIDFTVQATTKTGKEYRPLRSVKGLKCWPTTPLFDQLVEGNELQDPQYNLESAWSRWPGVGTRKLLAGVHFDSVVLGIPVAGLPRICKDLIAANAQWQGLVRKIQTIQTMGLQLWLKRDTRGLGWAGQLPAVASGYVEPLDTWGDMSALIPREDWPAAAQVRNISYFCGPFPDADVIPAVGADPDFPERERRRVEAFARQFLQTSIHPLWPRGTDPAHPAGLDWDLLVAPASQIGIQRLQSQFWSANIDPSARYVLSVKGSTAYRLRPDQSWFNNLVLAGDWTYNGLNAGFIEAAVMSGMQAARALTGSRRVIVGEADF